MVKITGINWSEIKDFILIVCYAVNIGLLAFWNIMHLEKFGDKDCGGNSQKADNDGPNRIDLRPLETLLLNVALVFGCMSFIRFVAFISA